MLRQFFFSSNPWLFPAATLLLLSLSIELPYRFAGSLFRGFVKDDAWNAVQAGIVTLAAFVVGLSFAQASERFDARRALVVKEANAIGTTWLRADQLESYAATRFRGTLTEYTAARLTAYETPHDPALYQRTIERSGREQAALWSIVSQALRTRPTDLGLSLLMQSLNETIDVSAEQLQALTSHVPTAILVLTVVLMWLSALSTGMRFARDNSRPLAISALFVIASVVVLSMVVDYDRPQTGFVKVNLNPIKLQLQSMQQPKGGAAK